MNEGSSKKGLIWAVVAVLVVAVGAFLFFAAQNGDEEDAVETDTTEVVEEEFAPQESIVDIVVSNPDFSILAQAVEQAALVDTLADDGPFTVFAPSDDAFAALLEELDITAEELLADESLQSILTYHVVEDAFFAEQVAGLDGKEVVTVNGQAVTITVDDESNVFVNDVQVIDTDIEASNGVIHVISGVLLPETE